MDDTAAVLTTLVFYLPIGLLTFFQVAEAGWRATSPSASGEPSPPPDTPVTNRNVEREAWVHASRSCASLSLL